MGIPSYFRHILSKYPQLLSGTTPYPGDILLVDFNCLIYGCIYDPELPAYTHESRLTWENLLIQTIEAYVKQLWNVAGKPKQVLLAVDGVVPMAKIRQQRLRRFKSVWYSEKEREMNGNQQKEVWDTNSITPGTEFMERLSRALANLCGTRHSWISSGIEMEGEGEQKLMAWVRAQPSGSLDGKRIIVYGLDADLIVLCLLHSTLVAPNTKWSILRESKEFGHLTAVDPFLLLDINGFSNILFPNKSTRGRDIVDYVCGMSLLGNDFLPHSLSVTIRNGGHDRLCRDLERLHEKSLYLTYEDELGRYHIQPETLYQLLHGWSLSEKEDMEHSFLKKYKMRPMAPKTEAERRMQPVENLPIEWAEEYAIWDRNNEQMREGWEASYYTESGPLKHEMCQAYLKGLQWILDYYTGTPVSYEWVYPSTYPPLWKDLSVYVSRQNTLPLPPTEGGPVKPQEQLTMVLPLESWWLIRDPVLRRMSSELPVFWPKQYGFHSLGKRWMWECYPSIPIIHPSRLRHYLQRALR
jgi:5'-3' exonuclease